MLGAQDEARRRVRRGRVTLLVVAVVVVLGLGVVVGFYAPAGLLEPSSPSSAWHGLGVVLLIVGLATVVVAGVRARRAGALRFVWNSPSATLPRDRRQRLLARVRRGLPVAPAEQADASAVADSLVRQIAMVPVYGGFALYILGQSLLASSVLSRWSGLVGAAIMTVALPLIARDGRRARTWLAHHGPQVD